MKPQHIVFVLDSNGFPNGMANTQRVKLYSKGLFENGINVTILCVRALERQPIENIEVKGCYHGVQFEYTSGTTMRANSFIKRRWLEIRGLLVLFSRIFRLKALGAIDCLYLVDVAGKLTFLGCIYKLLAALLKIPVIMELNERPWSLSDNPNYFEKRISPLMGVTAVVVISSLLKDWVQFEATRISKKVVVLSIPILVDARESKDPNFQLTNGSPKLLFAAAPQYDETIRFLLESMKIVVQKYPLCQLIITGVKDSDPAGDWLRYEKKKELQANLDLIGYIPRNDLLSLYRSSNVLLIPLFDDVRSKARFPTKLGEYLISGRPVVTNNVGELTQYLINGWNAFICEPGDPKVYADLIIKTLDDPIRANTIGQNGKEAAKQYFHYALWGRPLADLITEVCNK
jgi:glycosyltransferase involved in cell wall biosynthesis